MPEANWCCAWTICVASASKRPRKAEFTSSGQTILAEHRFDELQAQLDDPRHRLEALEKAG